MDSIPERYRWPINAGWLRDVFETEYVRLHGRKSLCHTDVWPPNVILSNGVAFIIDFDDLALTDPILDLASCIAEFAIVESGIVIEDAARAIFTGYLQSGLILHDQQIQDLVAGVCCSYASWLAMDSCHSVEFQNSAHYLTRLKTLQDAPGRQLALAALSTALQKAIQHTSN